MEDLGIGIALLGFVVGFLVGMTGMGGGALTTPVLILWVGVRPVVAVGTDLLFLAALKVVAAWAHHKWGNVDWRLVKLLALGSVPGAVVGLLLLSGLRGISEEATDAGVTRLLGLVLIVAAMAVLVQFFLGERRLRLPFSGGDDTAHAPTPRPIIVLGFVVGVLVSMTSVGGGSLVVASLVIFHRLSGRRIVGTDLAHALVLSAVATVGHIGMGSVIWVLALNLLVGAIPGVLLGSRATIRVPERGLRAIMGSALLVAGIAAVA
jgi:uncharacterized membrane protein YfcA